MFRPTASMGQSQQPAGMLYTQQQQHQQLLQQHQQQQQQQQLQQQQAQSTNGGTDAQSLSNSGPEKEMNLAGVLHYLQSEWRRWERDRNEWEIERAVMRARIAQLEGQRKSAENLKVDLLKRVKLLEHALRTERAASRMSGGTFGRSALPPSRLAALQDEDGKSRDEKESNASEGSDEGDRPKINGTSGSGVNGTPSLAMPMSRAATVALRQNADGNPWKNVGTASRDPKSRARSREYLKQCLQEITYLTSPGALNPLSPRPPISFDSLAPEDQSGPSGDDRKPPSVLISPPDRPQKLLPENPPPSLLSLVKEDTKDVPLVPNGIPNGGPREVNVKQERPPSPLAANLREDTKEEEAMHDIPLGGVDERNPPSSPAVQTMSLPDPDQTEEGTHLLTAIYRPDSKAAWREELRAANEQAEKVSLASAQISRVKPTPLDDDQLSSISFTSTDEDIMLSEGLDKSFHGRRTLKSHLDIVRSVSFAHGPHIVLASGGDDCTVKIWSIETTSIMTGHRPPSELEPIVTFRGHTAPITSVLISSMSKPSGLVFSGSMDSTIRVWRLPPGNHDPYAPYDPNMSVQTLESHGEAVWDLCLLPCADIKGKNRGDVRLASASADGSVKIWELQESDGKELWVPVDSLKTWGKVPTTVEMLNEQFGKLLIGLDTGEAQVWDIDSSPARCERTFGEETLNGQINGILSHPTLPLVVTASEDGRLRFYDTQSGNMTHNILAHPSPLTSIILSPLSPMSLITSSTDCTMRVWDIAKKTSLQDLIGHRQRSDEGVCGMAGHPELPVLASAGADGVVRVWAAV